MTLNNILKICLNIFFISFTAVITHAQEVICDDSIQLKRGIYKTFEEFKYNNPSIVTEFELEEKERITGYIQYSLKFIDPNLSSKESYYGFCDGKNVYFAGHIGFTKAYYDKVLFLGRYCYFKKFFQGYMAGKFATKISSVDKMFMNINNGKIFHLIKGNLEPVLKQDNEIYDEFQNDKDKRKEVVEYLKKYSLKHKDEIKR